MPRSAEPNRHYDACLLFFLILTDNFSQKLTFFVITSWQVRSSNSSFSQRSHLQVVSMDTLEKLRAVEENFFAVEQRLHATAGAMPDPIFVIDGSGRFLDVIGGRAESCYQGGDIFIGKNLHEVLPDLADIFMQTISAAIADNSLKTIEYPLDPADISDSALDAPEGMQWFEGRVSPLKNRAGEVHSVIWLNINITERKNLEEQLQELSEKDRLTGAYSRRYFMQIFEHEFSIVKRSKDKLSILLIAIDKFKEIKDKYGQDGSNTVLKRFVLFCEDNFRRSDLFARYDGEQFIVMLPNTPTIGAAIKAERVRANIEDLSITYNMQSIQFTISMGISLVLDTDTDSSAVISRARAALGQAGKEGHNRIEIG